MIRENNLKIEGILEEKLVELLRQALISGDFQACVDWKKGVVGHADYIPYRKVQELKNEVKELRKKIKQINDLTIKEKNHAN